MAYINPGSHPYSVHHHTPKTGYAFQNIHKPSIILKEESEFNNEYKVLGMGTIGEPTKRDRELEKQREIEKKKELEKQIEKEKIIEKEKEAANRNIINNNNGLNTINPLSGEKRSIFPLANEKKVEKIQIHIKKVVFFNNN